MSRYEFVDQERIVRLANRIIQVVLAILPIAAAITGLLFQQQRGTIFTTMIFMIWIAMLILSTAAIINLWIQYAPKAHESKDKERLVRVHRTGIILFTIGLVLLMLSPSGLWINSLFSDSTIITIDLADSQYNIQIPSNGTTSNHGSALLTYTGFGRSLVNVNLHVSADECIRIHPKQANFYLSNGQEKILEWTTSVGDDCIPGDYLTLIEVSINGKTVTSDVRHIRLQP